MRNKVIPLIPGNLYSLNGVLGGFYEYVGEFDSLKDVPKKPCIFVINGVLKRRRITIVEKKKRRAPKLTRDLYLDIKPEDNIPMVIAKMFLKKKGIGLEDFKQLYDNDSDMHNSRRAIEKGGRLSWERFEDIIHRCGGRHTLTVEDDDDDYYGMKENE